MATLTERTINGFEEKVMQLITITNITKLPQWTDVDKIGAECLLKEYRKLQQEPKQIIFAGPDLLK